MRFLNSGLRALLALSAVITFGCGSTPQTYVERGNHFFDAGRYEDAAIQYEKAVQKAPNLGEAHYRLGLVDLKRNQPVAAYRELQSAVDLMPGNDEALAKLGELALSLYNADPRRPRQLRDQASKAAERLINENVASFGGNLLMGALALIDQRPADAVDYFRKAVQAKPDNMDAKLDLARALVEDNQGPTGMSLAMDVIRKDKTSGAAYDFLYQQYRASGQTAEAENILKLKVSNNPKQAAFLLELARYYAAAQKPSEVNATVQKLTGNPANFPQGHLLAGDFYNSVGRPEEALGQYREGLQARPKDQISYQKRIAGILATQRKWAEALQQLSAILKDKPEDEESKLNRALVWLDEGKPENLDPAIAELRAQSVMKPDDATLHFQLGGALARKDDQDGAGREWSVAARQNKQYLPPRFALVQMDLAQGKAQEALRISEEIVTVAPRDQQSRLMHVTCQMAVGQFPQARAELSRLSADFPQSIEVKLRVGFLALSEKKFGEAAQTFEKLAAVAGPDPRLYSGLAQAYMGMKEPAKAMQTLEDQVKRNPGSTGLRQVLAQAALSSGEYDIAVEQYRQLAAATPGSIEIQRALAGAYRAEGNATAAAGVLETAVRQNPSNVKALLDLAHALVSAGRVGDAKVRYRQLLKIQPDNANALNDLSYLMAESDENLDEALTLARRGAQLATDQGLRTALADTSGWIYLKKNMYDSALRSFQIAVSNDPGNMAFHYHLGMTLYRMGNKLKAKAELEAALAATPKSADEPKIRELLARF